MKNFISLLIILTLSFSSAAIAQVTISNLPNGGSVQNNDIVPIVRSGVTMKANAFTAPTNGSIMVSNGATAPNGLAETDGECAIGQGGVWTVANCLEEIANNTILGNVSGSTSTPSALTGTQVVTSLPVFTSTGKGVVPASGGSSSTYLNGAGTFTTPASGGTPGGSSGQLQYNNSGTFAGFTMSGDCTIVPGTGVITCLKSNGTNFGTAAFATAPSGTIVGTSDSQLLTNKSISGALNTLSNIGTGSLLTVQGNGAKVQLSTGTTTTNDCVKYDGNGNAVDAGAPCGSGSGGTPGGSNGQLQYNSSGSFAGLSNTNKAFQFLTSDGTNLNFGNPANFVDPRTYGASCVGPGYSGGLSSGAQGLLIVNPGSGLTTGTYTAVPFTGGSGTGGIATVTVSGGVVTGVSVSTVGATYKLRDQLSFALANIGGSGTAPTIQVAHLNTNYTPIYDGTHDDTAAFLTAYAISQNTGQSVLVPNGCWISSLNIPQGVNMVGNWGAVTYSYDMLGGTADAMPVLYLEGNPTYGIQFGYDPNNAFVGFEVNASANSGAYGSTFCIGTGTNGGGGTAKVFMINMSLKGCFAGLGTPDGATIFLLSQMTDYGANQNGIYGNLSDLYSSGDTFVSTTTGIYLAGGAGEVRITNARIEYNAIGFDIENFGNVKCDNCEFDHNSTTGLKIGSSAHDIFFTGGSFQNNGTTGTAGHDSHVLLARTTTATMNLHFSNTYFSNYGATPKYVFESSTAAADNDYLYVEGGDGLNGYTTSYFNWTAGTPAHQKILTTGTPYLDSIDSGLSFNGLGGVGMGTTTPDPNMILDMTNSALGLGFPVWTSSTRPSVTSGKFPIGFNSTIGSVEIWSGSAWTSLGGVSLTGNNTYTGTNTYQATTTYTGPAVYSGGVQPNFRNITTSGAVTMATTDYGICIEKTTGAPTIVNLPSSPLINQVYIVKDCKGDASTNNITVTPASGPIDGSASIIINSPYLSEGFFWNGTQWFTE